MLRSKLIKKRLPIFIAAAIAGVGSVAVQAQNQKGVTLEEVVVTAQKREQNLQEVPIAVTSYNARELEYKAITTIADLEKSIPNAQFRASRGTNSTLTAFIRGIGQQDPLWGFEPGVGIYVDDVYYARPQAAVMDVFDVDRIEVLRGPQGTLYGKNTIGGAIKYVTKPMSGEAAAKMKVAVGDYGQKEITVSGQLPIIEDKLFVGAAINKIERDGYGTQYKDYDSASGTFGRQEENYNKDVLTGRFSLEYHPIDALSLRFSADKTEDESNNPCGSRFATNTVAGPNGEFFAPLADPFDSACGMTEKGNVESEGVSFTANYDINDSLAVKYIYADREGNTETFIDFDGTPLDSFEVPAFYKDDQKSHELQANYSQPGFTLVGGIYYFEGNAAGAFDALFGQFGGGVLSGVQFSNAVFGDVDTESTSFYINGEFDITDSLTLTAGVRHTKDEKAASVNRQFVLTSGSIVGTTTQGSGLTFGNSATDTVLAVRTNFSKDDANDEWSETSPTLKLSWSINDDVMLYGGWAQGFKSGGFDMRADAAVAPNAVDGYAPETVDTFELGVKAQLFEDRVRMNVSVFKSDFEDMQVTVQAPAPAPAFFSSAVVNAGEAEIEGVEAEATIQITEGLMANVVIGYLNAEFVEVIDAVYGNVADPYDDGFGNIIDPWEMQNSPNWNGQLGLTYSTDFGQMGSMVFSSAVSYRDDTRMFDQTASILDQKSYTLWDASAAWYSADEHWSAVLQIKNINDKTYRTGGYNFPATAGEDAIVGFYGAPRTWTLSLAYEF